MWSTAYEAEKRVTAAVEKAQEMKYWLNMSSLVPATAKTHSTN
jgi:hypothetical protein